MATRAIVLTIITCTFNIYLASAKFLAERPASVDGNAFKDEIMNAMGSMLGCGGQADPGHIADIRRVLTPMWKTLPKTYDRIDRRSLRYLVHRYFMQTSSLMIRGFEPTRPVNESHWGVADVLSQMVPAFVESVLDRKHNTQHGFSLQDAVDMVLMLDQLIFDSESTVLETVYQNQRKPLQRSLSFHGLKQVLEEYMIMWMVEADPKDHAMLVKNRSFVAEVLPHYHSLMAFAEGQIKSFEYERQQQLGATKNSKSQDGSAWEMKYSFQDAHAIVGGITRSFQSFWQSECESMKDALVSMDSRKTGRVPLAKFYNTAVNTDWRFGESETYLRELGALDESSKWIGPQVIIPNYLQATSNCIVSTPHYHVCCVNECESLLGEIELAINAPTALPNDILTVIGAMSTPTLLDDDSAPHIDRGLKSQLEQIAQKHGGMVPLHGRLFAQWLHYVFPRECPFPHKVGMVSSVTPTEHGQAIATAEEMRRHAANVSAFDFVDSVHEEELQWMSQWSQEEELMVDYSSELGTSWKESLVFSLIGMLLVVGGLWGGVISCSKAGSKTTSESSYHVKSHWV
jgi:hypothetical protein